MGLLVYKFSEYEHTAEREQYRALCKQLKEYYNGRNEICIFVANYNIFDCELDGILIKQDAIMAVEFKNYGGIITAVDNGHWKDSDGNIIKGGSRKTVYQQANLNHVAIKRGFKDGQILPSHALRNVAALVVFHQPIQLINRLSPRAQSWLHVCDETTFLEKVQDITSSSFYLSEEDMLELAKKMALDSDYLDKIYSNTDLLSKDIGKVETSKGHSESETDETPSASVQVLDEERQGLHDFVEIILRKVLKCEKSKIDIFYTKDAQPLFDSYNVIFTKKYLITIEAQGIGATCQKLGRFINHEVHAINNNLIYWEDGEPLDSPVTIEQKVENISEEPTVQSNPSKVQFRKSKTVLPHWLDRKIFSELGAVYAPEHERYEHNLNLNREELKVYLGTYFPRSYAEMFCIIDNLLGNEIFRHNVPSHIDVLDCGCGTGGELLGFVTAINKYSSCSEVSMTAIDGNEGALSILKDIIEEYPQTEIHIQLSTIHQTLSSKKDLMYINKDRKKYDFILCDKMVCELIFEQVLSADGYAEIAKLFAPHLSDTGLLIILDVTTKDEHSGYFYPQLMNKYLNDYCEKSRTINTLLPLSCACNSNCNELCFMQQTFTVSHSHKSLDESRVCYRILCRKSYQRKLLQNINTSNVSHIIHSTRYKQNEVTSMCRLSNKYDQQIDSFNINS